MRIVFLGTGGYHPNERRQTNCVLLPESGIAFDAGTAAFRIAAHLATPELTIFLSHAHLDHIVGLTYLLVPIYEGRIQHARVLGTPETLQAVREHLFAAPVFPVLPDYDWQPLSDRVELADGGVLTHLPLEHPGGSTGYRIDWPDKSLAYITDTTATDEASYLEFIRGVDLLIHECNFPDEMSEWSLKCGHSNTTPVAELAKRAAVGRLFLTHIDPQRADDDPINLQQAQSIFPKTELAEDLLEVNF